MPHPLIRYFSRLATLSQSEIDALLESIEYKTVRKGEFLLREGQLTADSYFVQEGCVRQYALVDGEERTTHFFTESQWLLSPNGLSAPKPSGFYWVAAEDAVLVVGNERKAQQLFQQFPRFETISRAVMEAAFAEQQALYASYLLDSPETRYLKLLERRPDLFQRIPQYHLASYIGVKPESLSRIRKRLATKRDSDLA